MSSNTLRGTKNSEVMRRHQIAFDDETVQQVKRMACARNVSFSEMVRLLVEWGIEDLPRKATGNKGIDVGKARSLYDQHRSWAVVAEKMPRQDGTVFKTNSLSAAVRRLDKAE